MKTRLDKLLVERGLVPTRERAQALILAGRVLVNEQKLDKPGHSVSDDASIRLLGGDLRYVSRGGLKLEAALAHWHIDLANRFCCDVGASTGGFSDCMLQHGAARVLAVDTGYGQIAQTLRDDARVTLMERTNARLLNPGDLPPEISFLAVDVSFISATLVLPPVLDALRPASDTPVPDVRHASDAVRHHSKPENLTEQAGNTASTEDAAALKGQGFSRAVEQEDAAASKGQDLIQAEKREDAAALKGHGFSRAEKGSKEKGALAPAGGSPHQLEAVILIKPQFEAGRERIGKGGIVRDPAAHQLAIDRVRTCAAELGAQNLEVLESPITGAEGNREFLLHAQWN
jgi:23S rRNA (cytidine1920-2'-O)/16S rRNA (cytidine1409-2'-O)-methyltransferase